ncbi:NUDIX hydrolase domain-like protein [Trichoderma novae-zelandiae]
MCTEFAAAMSTENQQEEKPAVRVGVSTVLMNDEGEFLVGKRIGSHGEGTWQFPGGHIDHGETVANCAVREMKEETELEVEFKGIFAITNDVFVKEVKHYITLFSLCVMKDPNAVPVLVEPHKCQGWVWKSWEDLMKIHDAAESGASTERLFLPIENLAKQTRSIHTLLPTKEDVRILFHLDISFIILSFISLLRRRRY